MSLIERAGLCALHRLDPELAHGLSLKALSAGLVPLPGAFTSPRLATTSAAPTSPLTVYPCRSSSAFMGA